MTEEYKVVRIIVYQGEKKWLQAQMVRSLNDGTRVLNNCPRNSITVATAYSNLPEALEEHSPEKEIFDVTKEEYAKDEEYNAENETG